MLISPDEVKTKAKSKENENYAFRTYLKMHADPHKLDEQFRKLHEEMRIRTSWMNSFGSCMKNYFPDMTAVNAAIAAKCIAA